MNCFGCWLVSDAGSRTVVAAFAACSATSRWLAASVRPSATVGIAGTKWLVGRVGIGAAVSPMFDATVSSVSFKVAERAARKVASLLPSAAGAGSGDTVSRAASAAATDSKRLVKLTAGWGAVSSCGSFHCGGRTARTEAGSGRAVTAAVNACR